MTHSNAWSVTTPADTELAGEGDDELIKAKIDLKERIAVDHYMDGILDPLEANCDGYHKKVTLHALSSDPTPPEGAGIVYTKLVDSIEELFFIDSATETPNQITENGVLGSNIMTQDLDANDFKISGGTLQGIHQAADGSAGYTGSISFNGVTNWYTSGITYVMAYNTYTLTVKNGLITSYSATSGSVTA